MIRHMETPYSYTRAELLALRDKLQLALREREAVLGRSEIRTVGSVAMESDKPNDIDLRVSIEKSLSDPPVAAAAKEAICSVIRANCFDGPNARILQKASVWQWPLDVGISDGTGCLWLKGMNRKTDEINFFFEAQIKRTRDFPDLSPSAPPPVSARKEED